MVLAYGLILQVPKQRHIPKWTISSLTKICKEVAVWRRNLLIPSRNIIYKASNRTVLTQNSMFPRCSMNKNSVFNFRSSQDLTFCVKSRNWFKTNLDIVRWASNNTYQTINQFKKPEGFSAIYINSQRKWFIWFPAVMALSFLVLIGMSIGFLLSADYENLIYKDYKGFSYTVGSGLICAVTIQIMIGLVLRRSLFSIYRKDGLEKVYMAVRPQYGFYIEEIHFKHEDINPLNPRLFGVGKNKFFVRQEDFATPASYDEFLGNEIKRKVISETEQIKGQHIDKFQERMKKKLDQHPKKKT